VEEAGATEAEACEEAEEAGATEAEEVEEAGATEADACEEADAYEEAIDELNTIQLYSIFNN
jgi:hypothetical protein